MDLPLPMEQWKDKLVMTYTGGDMWHVGLSPIPCLYTMTYNLESLPLISGTKLRCIYHLPGTGWHECLYALGPLGVTWTLSWTAAMALLHRLGREWLMEDLDGNYTWRGGLFSWRRPFISKAHGKGPWWCVTGKSLSCTEEWAELEARLFYLERATKAPEVRQICHDWHTYKS